MQSVASTERKNINKDSCQNCGAPLEIASKVRKCAYCGGVFETDNQPEEEPQNKSVDIKISLDTRTTIQPPNKKSNGVSPIVIFFAVVVASIIIIIISKAVDTSNSISSVGNAADTIRVDTTTGRNTSPAAAVADTLTNDTLKALASIPVTPDIFKKLYSAARKKYDRFSQSTNVSDKTSPQYVNMNGIYAYISRETYENDLRFCMQYYADDWLFISDVTIDADGKVDTYKEEFKRDNGGGKIWEWTDFSVYSSWLETLANMATAKRADIKYDGDKYYKVVTVSKSQKAALKHVLQIYKGILLGYDKKLGK